MNRRLFVPLTPLLYPFIGNPHYQWGGFNDGSNRNIPYGIQASYTVYPTALGDYRVYQDGSQIFVPRPSAQPTASFSFQRNYQNLNRLQSGLLNLIQPGNRFYSTTTSSVLATLIKLTNPVKVYHNVELERREILKDNTGRIGIYLWFNNITNQFYVGSSKNLGSRFRSYFSPAFLNRTKNSNMIISPGGAPLGPPGPAGEIFN
jgi:hypothetical protein